MKRKTEHFLARTLALALALILTLGTLPLMSFAQELGVSEATKPANPQGDETNYKYSIRAQLFFATGVIHSNNHYSNGGFWPEWKLAPEGTIYSNKLDFSKLGLTPTHYVVGTPDFAVIDDAVYTLKYGNNQVTDYFNKDELNQQEFKQAIVSEIKRIHEDEVNGQKFIIKDNKGNDVIIDPDKLMDDRFQIILFRYANQVVNHGKMHLDLHIERPDAKPITLTKMNLPGGEQQIVSQEKYGNVLSLEEDGFVVSKVEVTVGANTYTYATPDEIKNNPIIHDDDEKQVKVWYSKNIKFHVIKDNAAPEEVGEYLAELGKDYDVTGVLTAANVPVEYEYKGMKLKEVGADLLDKAKIIPAADITKDLNDVYLCFETIDNKSHIHVTIEKEGEAPTTQDIELTIGDTYHIPAIPSGYVLESFIVDGIPQAAGVVSFTVTKPNHVVVVKFVKKTSGDILVVPSTLDDAPFTLEELNKYGLQQISIPSQPGVPVEIEMAEPKGLKIKSVMNGTVEVQPNGEGKYVVTNNSPDQLVLSVHYKKHMSSLNVTQVKDGVETGPTVVNGQVGEEYMPNPVAGYDIELYVKVPGGDYGKVDRIEFTDAVQDVKVVYVKKPDNNNNNNNDNNNEEDRDRDEYREYNPDKDKKNQGEVITDDGNTPLGPLDKLPYYAYLQGYPDGSVRPAAHVSRQETAAVFFRLLDATYRESIRSEDNPFRDVDKSTWSNKHISTLAKAGIVRGYTDGTFRPEQIITRAELIEIASNFDAADGKTKHNFKSMNDELAPNTLVTRADFAKIVNKVLGRNVKKSEIPAGVKQFTDLTPDMDSYEDMMTATNSYSAIKGDGAYQKWVELIPANIEM